MRYFMDKDFGARVSVDLQTPCLLACTVQARTKHRATVADDQRRDWRIRRHAPIRRFCADADSALASAAFVAPTQNRWPWNRYLPRPWAYEAMHAIGGVALRGG